jgi:hypothetical protein
LRILFLETEPVTSEVRIRPLLDDLVRSGGLSGYAVVDRTMAVRGTVGSYDVALTHRIPSRRQFAWLQRHNPPLVYDIDDLLLNAGNSTPQGRRNSERKRIEWCLSNSQFVTCPSMRLLNNISAHCSAERRDNFRYLPNAGRDTASVIKVRARPTLLWASSSENIVSRELLATVHGLELARRELKFEIILLGRFPAAIGEIIEDHKPHRSWLPYPAYLDLLEQNAFVAMAPLAGDLSPAEQAFVDCKSDIKAAQYGSSRIAGAYSARPPYAESDLPCELVRANTTEAWRDAIGNLVEGFPAAGNEIGGHDAFLRRRPRVIAEQLLALFETARQERPRPFGFFSIPTPRFLGKIERRFRRACSRLRGPR